MDLSFTPEEVAFRQDLRSFFTTAIPQSIRTKVLEGQHLTKEEIITAQRILNANGLAVPGAEAAAVMAVMSPGPEAVLAYREWLLRRLGWQAP